MAGSNRRASPRPASILSAFSTSDPPPSRSPVFRWRKLPAPATAGQQLMVDDSLHGHGLIGPVEEFELPAEDRRPRHGHHESQRRADIVGGREPLERGSQVVPLIPEDGHRPHRVRRRQATASRPRRRPGSATHAEPAIGRCRRGRRACPLRTAEAFPGGRSGWPGPFDRPRPWIGSPQRPGHRPCPHRLLPRPRPRRRRTPGEPASEHRERREQHLLSWFEEVVGPLHGGLQRPVPLNPARRAAPQQTEPHVEAGRRSPGRSSTGRGPLPVRAPTASDRAAGTGLPPPGDCPRPVAKVGSTARARSVNSMTAASSSSAGTGKMCSPATASGSRLVASTTL